MYWETLQVLKNRYGVKWYKDYLDNLNCEEYSEHIKIIQDHKKKWFKEYALKNKDRIKQNHIRFRRNRPDYYRNYLKQYLLDNPDKKKEYAKKLWEKRKKNANYIKYKKKWEFENKDKIKKHKHEYYLKHYVECKFKNGEWYEKNKTKVLIRQKYNYYKNKLKLLIIKGGIYG